MSVAFVDIYHVWDGADISRVKWWDGESHIVPVASLQSGRSELPSGSLSFPTSTARAITLSLFSVCTSTSNIVYFVSILGSFYSHN